MPKRNTDNVPNVRGGDNVVSILVMIMLGIETVADIRSRSVSAVRLIIFAAVAVAVNIIFYYQSIWSMIGGIAVGAVLFLYALLTSESIGYGDCLIFVCAGAYIGFADNLELLFFSLLAVAAAGGIYALAAHKTIKTRIPFVPCIMAVYFIMLVIKAVKGDDII